MGVGLLIEEVEAPPFFLFVPTEIPLNLRKPMVLRCWINGIAESKEGELNRAPNFGEIM